MALTDFIDERRVLVYGARRFVIRQASVATVLTVLRVYAHEIATIAHAAKLTPGLLGDDSASAVLATLMRPGDRRMGECLRHSVELHGGAPGELDDAIVADIGLAELLIREMLRLTDVRRVIEFFGVADADPDALVGEPEAGVSDLELILLRAAELSRVPPAEVSTWPVGLFMTFRDAYSAKADASERSVPAHMLAPDSAWQAVRE